MKNYITPSYTFTPGASGVGTVDTNIVSFNVKLLVAIVNQTRNTIIYGSGLTGRGYTNLSGDILTLEFDTTGHNSGDVLQFIYDDIEQPLTDTQLRNTPVPVSANAPAALLTSYTQTGVIAINTILTTLDCSIYRGVSIQCTSMGTTGVVTVESSNDNTTWVATTILTPAGASAATITAIGLWTLPVSARYVRLRMSTATTAGTTTFSIHQFNDRNQMWLAAQPLAAAVVRIGTVGTAGIWYDDSSATLLANATFTGTSRDITLTATATAWANAATYAQELVVSAESDVTGTLFLEVSRDNTTWQRVKTIATTAVTGGGFYAEIVHKPSWRYARVGYVNGATNQARFTINSITKAI
jgi:hypothetical protein